jgi:hypothetical protein
MGIQVVTAAVSVGVEPGSAEGAEETIVHQGALIPDWVDDFTRFVLTSTGMGKYVEDPDPALTRAAAPAATVLLPEHVPPDPGTEAEQVEVERAKVEGLARGRGGVSPGKAGESDEDAPPPQNAPKADWVDYAEKRGMPREEAEATSKEQLVGRFSRR